MTKSRRKRDWRTPLLLTLSAHLMVFTLAINHRLFSMFVEPSVGQYTMKVSDITGADPESDEQDEDPGASAGEESEQVNPNENASVKEAFEALETAEVPDKNERADAATAKEKAETGDALSLSDRLAASMQAAGGGGESGESVVVPGGGSHGLRGEGNHGVGLKRHGGSGETEDAVHMGLNWLVKVQDSDGKWDSDGYMVHYLNNPTSAERLEEGVGLARNDIGLTALCMLAFTGAGYHDHDGDYRQTVSRARRYLMSKQRVEDGGFGGDGDGPTVTMYAHSLATFAITDLYLVSGDEKLRTPMRRALEYLLTMQGPGGGWDYHQRYPSRRDDFKLSKRNDLSISGWAVLALIAAREANFEIPKDNLRRLADYLQTATRKDGEAVYANQGTRAGHRGMAMLACSNVCRRLLGEPVNAQMQKKQLERMADNPPNWNDADALFGSNMYYWYYGSLGMLIAKDGEGGADRWRQWNISLKKTLLDNQVTSGARRGSFDPVGHWAKSGGGRVYSTALCVLNLEIYYRYEPEYLRVRADELAWLWPQD